MSGDWWDNFTNNLATDFAPLVALFGESPTKQYLSECLTATDILIFATAPLGVITAIVSAIRVCGTPSLRAFIGRAQEGAGNAEAELCSSTSRDVCELYNNGGIARVFGRPKLLEIVHDSHASMEDFFVQKGNKRPTAGIYSFEQFKNEKDCRDDEWREVTGRSTLRLHTFKNILCGKRTNTQYQPEPQKKFAQNPNLSLNVGIKPLPKPYFYAAAALGLILQSAVLAWAVFARYWFNLIRNDVQDKYAVPFAVVGTICLDFGVGLCAYLVERSTKERVFERKLASDHSNLPPRTRMYWIQPGNQIIGDQVFDSFAYTDLKSPITTYTTSWKQDELEQRVFSTMKLIWTAVLSALIGFIVQFIGLRACHSSVSLAQLGATVVMSIVRASLRTQRMQKKDNMAKDANLFQGHELDWLALEISFSTPNSPNEDEIFRISWLIFSHYGGDNVQVKAYSREGKTRDPKNEVSDLQFDRHNLHEKKYFNLVENSCERSDEGQPSTVLQLSFYKNSSKALVGLCWIDGEGILFNGTVSHVFKLHPSHPAIETTGPQADLQKSTRAFFHRSQLARMTGSDHIDSGGSNEWNENLVSVRHTAQILAEAIEATASVLFDTDTAPPIEFESSWKNSFSIFCPINVFDPSGDDMENNSVFISLNRTSERDTNPDGPWQVDKAELEALLGLWTWSLRKKLSPLSQTSKIRSSRLFKESASVEIDVWRQRDAKKIQKITLRDGSFKKTDDVSLHARDSAEVQNSLWWRDKKVFVRNFALQGTNEKRGPPEEADKTRYFFGLQYLDSPDGYVDPISALELAPARPLVLGCAQELYAKFFDATMHSIKSLGGESEVKKGRQSFYFANENIDRLYAAFTESGLGSMEDAFACIIPILHMQKKLPSVSNAHTQAREIAARHIKEGNWIQGSNVLEWALLRSQTSTDSSKTARNDQRLWVLTLCEYCRLSLRDERLRKSMFPYKRIASLLRSQYCRLREDETPLHFVDRSILTGAAGEHESETLAQTLLSYAQAISWLANEVGDTIGVNLVNAALIDGKIPVLEREPPRSVDASRPKSFLEAVKQGNLSYALYLSDSKDVRAILNGRTALSYAAENGWFMIVEGLVNAKADLDAIDRLDRSSVYYAAQSGDINTFRNLLSNGASPHIPDKRGRTALDCAADGDHLTIIQELLADTRVDPNLKDESSQTPLTRAVRRGASEVVNALLSSDRVYQTSQDKERLTDLMHAVDNDQMETVQQLVRNNVVNTRAKDNKGRTVLSRSALHGQRQFFQYLLEFDPSLVQTRDNTGRSPLSLAVGGLEERGRGQGGDEILQSGLARRATDVARYSDYDAIIDQLLRHPDVDRNEQDDQAKTPLFHAVSAGNTAAVNRLLAEDSVDLNLADSNHESPLAIAIKNRSYEIALCLLVSPKTNVSHINRFGDSSLSLAAHVGYSAIVEQVLYLSTLSRREEYTRGSDESLQDEPSYVAEFVNSANVEGYTALMIAAREGNGAIADMILSQKKVDVNTRNENGDTPLILAARNGLESTAQKLLQRGDIQVNVQNSLGKTALIEAVEHQQILVVQMLLLHAELDANLRNSQGRTALQLAALEHESPVLHCLLENDNVEREIEDETGNTPLLAAAQNGKYRMVIVLVESGKFDLQRRNHDGRSLLSYAATHGWKDVAEIVLSQNWDSRSDLDANGRDALSYAASSSHDPLETVQMLIQKGFDPTRPDAHGRTPIWYAAKNNYAEILVYLMSITGINVDQSDDMERTTLSYEAGQHHVSMVKTLLSIKEVNPDSMDKFTLTPLLYSILEAANQAGNLSGRAAWFRLPLPPWPPNMTNDAEVIELLLATRRVNPDRTFSEKRYLAIHFAAVLGYEKAVLALLPWVRPEERPAMRRLLAVTNMKQAWASMASSEQWQLREEESTTMNGTILSARENPTLNLLERDNRFTDLIRWAENVVQKGKPYKPFLGVTAHLIPFD